MTKKIEKRDIAEVPDFIHKFMNKYIAETENN